jgi:hypothetical protein
MAAMDAVITMDDTQHIVLVNPAAERMFHCSHGEMDGAPLTRFIPARYRLAHQGHVERFGATSVTFRRRGGRTPSLACARTARSFR